VIQLPNLDHLSHAQKDELIRALWAQVQALTLRVAELEARLGGPPKTPNNSSLPPSKGQKPNVDEKPKREGPRKVSIGRKGGGRALEAHPDETVITRPVCCAQCLTAFLEADLKLSARYDKIDLPPVKPVVTRVERFAGHCQNCGEITLAPVPEALEPGTPFSINIITFALYLRFTHAISYKRLTNLMLEVFGLTVSEGALDAMFQRSKNCLDAEVSAVLARLRRARVIYSDETGVRVNGKGHWNWVFQNTEVVIHVIRNSRGAGVVDEVMDGHRPVIWVSDLYGAQRGHADAWQVCLAHQLRDCQFAIDAGDAIFAPRMKMLFLRAFGLARRKHLADSTRRQYY
jgi:transposase